MDAVSSFRPFPEITRNFAETQPGSIALSFEGAETTYADFERHTDQVANGLLAAGVKPGDRVAFFGKNSDTYFEVFFGAAKMGSVTSPINWRLAGPEVAYILRDSRAPILFVGPEFIELLKKIVGECPDLKTIIATQAKAGNWPSYAEWREANPDTIPQHRLEPASDALQLYTSGTTGRAKGVVLSAGNLVSLQEVMDRTGAEWAQWSPGDVSLVAMPVGHIAGTGWGFWTLVRGAKAIIVRDFDPGRILDLIERENIKKLFLVPCALQAVINHPRAREVDYGHLQYISYGASPIPLALLRECVHVFGCGFIQMYGMTETTGTVVALPPEDHTMEDSAKMRSAGKPLPGVEIIILDAAGNRLAAHEVGEIAIRSASNMKGYWNQPDATQATIDEDGWLRTGDAGYLDEEGYLYIHDRVKDMIISGGENVYPAEVENAIYGHPDVAEVAVIGVPSQRWGEEVKAIVVPKPGRMPREDDVIAWARADFRVQDAEKRRGDRRIPAHRDGQGAAPAAPGKVLARLRAQGELSPLLKMRGTPVLCLFAQPSPSHQSIPSSRVHYGPA